MKKAFFTLLATSALACANDVVYDFFSQDMSDLSTGTTWGPDAQGHSGTITSGYKNEAKPTATSGTIKNHVLDWEMVDYNQGYKRFSFDEINLQAGQKMTLMFDVILQESGYDTLHNYEGIKTSIVSLGITNVGIGSNSGAGVSAMTTGSAADGYNNSINAPILTLDENYAGKTINFVTTYSFDGTYWVAELAMTCDGTTVTKTINAADTKTLSVDHLYVSMDGTNWKDGETTKNTTSKMANLKLIVADVPEPATATLSLLALAGLCARRRR